MATLAIYWFDCLYACGQDLRDRSLAIRRHVLEGKVDGHQFILPARRLAPNGLDAWQEVIARGYEGLVGKDEAAPCREGRTLAWLKVKQPEPREDRRLAIRRVGVPAREHCVVCGEAQPMVSYTYPDGRVIRIHSACDNVWHEERERP